MNLDTDFIRRATKITSFNIMASDFTSIRYKNELRHLFSIHIIPELEDAGYSSNIDTSLNNKIRVLKTSPYFDSLFNYNLKGVGPGEVMLYLLVDSAKLGGGSSAGVDIVTNAGGYEIKAVKLSADKKFMSDFKLGGTVKEMPNLIVALVELANKLRIPVSRTEIPKSTIASIKQKAPGDFAKIEAQYSKAAGNYFAGHPTIFMNATPSRDSFGTLIAVKNVKSSDIKIERVTSNTIKPIISV